MTWKIKTFLSNNPVALVILFEGFLDCNNIPGNFTTIWAAWIMSQLLDCMRDHVRTLYYSVRTEHASLLWAKKFVLFYGTRHPAEMGEKEVSLVASPPGVPRMRLPAVTRPGSPG